MKTGAKRTIDLFVVILLAAITITLAVLVHVRNTGTTQTAKPSPEASHQPAIPESGPGAKTYIDKASKEADLQHYRQAISILEEGIKAYPQDQNLQLTKEYYEREATRYGQ